MVPAPFVLDARDAWLLLSALPGIPLHDGTVWRDRPNQVAHIIATALLALERAGVTHGDLCLPNILGDSDDGRLTGIVDWRFAGRYGPEIDVAAAVWSCGFNGYADEVAMAVLRGCHWPRADLSEVEALRKEWLDLS
jgi:aminoglycoside phosphotransferase